MENLTELEEHYYQAVEATKLLEAPEIHITDSAVDYPRDEFEEWAHKVDIYNLGEEKADFYLDKVIVNKFGDYRCVVAKELAKYFKYDGIGMRGQLNNIGSCYDGSKVGRMNEVDSLYVLDGEDILVEETTKAGFYRVVLKQGNTRTEIVPRKIRNQFADAYCDLVSKLPLTDCLEHGGMKSPHYSGLRYNGPAATSQFLTGQKEQNKSLLTWDVTPTFCLPKDHPICQEVRRLIEPIIQKISDRMFDKTEVHLFSDASQNLWRLSTAQLEADILRELHPNTPMKIALSFCKVLSSRLKRWNAKHLKIPITEDCSDPMHILQELDKYLEYSADLDESGIDYMDRMMRYAHIWLPPGKRKLYNEDEKSYISINTAAVKHIILSAALAKPEAFTASGDMDLVLELMQQVFQALGNTSQYSVPHALLSGCNIPLFSVLGQAAEQKMAMALCIKEQCRTLLSTAMTRSIWTSGIPEFVNELNQCAVSTEAITTPEYAFQVTINPYQHPMFDRNMQHLLAMLVSLSNTCGGIVYLTANPELKVTTDAFSLFHNRLVELTCSETKLSQQLMVVRQLESHRAWGCIILEKSQQKLNYCLWQPTWNDKMTSAEYSNDILGFIRAQEVLSGENKEPLVETIHGLTWDDTTTWPEYSNDILGFIRKQEVVSGENKDPLVETNHGTAAEIKESPIPDVHPSKEDDAAQCSAVDSTPGDSGDTPDTHEKTVNYSMCSKLDWSKNKKGWKNYVKTKHSSVDDIIKSCPMWEPATPMRVTPDVGMLRELFGSEQWDEILSRIATEQPGFAIVCKAWSFILPEKICQTSPEGRVCDVLTVSQTGEISFWVILDSHCKTATREHIKYMMKTARMIKYQLVKQSYPACLNLHVQCHLVRTNGGDIEHGSAFSLDQIEEVETLFSQLCKGKTDFVLLQRALAVNILSKECLLKQCVGDQTSVTLSARQAEVLMHKAKVNYISGPAGSGKSFIALQLYKMHSGHKSVYICTTRPFLECLGYNGYRGVLVQSDQDLRHEIRGGTFTGKECVIIDDSHNFMCSRSTVKELFYILKDHSEMSLFVFADNDYQSFDRKRQEAAYDCFHSLTREVLGQKPRVEYLTEIYRNSQKIVSFLQSAVQNPFSGSQTITCANPEVGEGIECIKVEDLWESNTENKFIAYLIPVLSSELYRPSEIAILLDVSYTEEQIDRCRRMLTQHFPQLKQQTADVFPRIGVIVDSVMSFLGLDASLCIFILPQVSRKSEPRNFFKDFFRKKRPNSGPEFTNPHYRVFLASRATHKAVFIVPQIDAVLVHQMKFDRFLGMHSWDYGKCYNMRNPMMRIVLLGENYCGKTSLLDRYIHNRFIRYGATTVENFSVKKIDVEGCDVKLCIFDTAGTRRHDFISMAYCRDAQAAVVCMDLTNNFMFDRAKFFINEVHKNEKHCRLYLCITKRDLVDHHEKNTDLCQVDYDTVMDYAGDIRVEVFETSSKTSENVHEMFFKIAQDYLRESKNSISSADAEKAF